MKTIMTPRGMLPEYWIAEKQDKGKDYGGTIYHAYEPHNILYTGLPQFLVLQWEEGISSPRCTADRRFDTREEAEKEIEKYNK